MGSLKFDAAKLDERRSLDVPAMLRQLGVRRRRADCSSAAARMPARKRFWRSSSSGLRARFPDLFLVLVPRHFERSREVGRELERARRQVRLSQRDHRPARSIAPGEVDCLLVNTTGELKYFYEHATVIFVGKSLTAEGGQNPIEPGALGKAMVFGPNMQNFAEVVAQLSGAERRGAGAGRGGTGTGAGRTAGR